MKTFRCGHPRSPENSRLTKGFFQCKRCVRERRQARTARGKQLAALGEVQDVPGHNRGTYQHLCGAEAVFSDDGGAAAIGRASASLLNAIYRQHPYVFDAAERSGRLAVRP